MAHSDPLCVVCEQPAHPKRALPVDGNGSIVPLSHRGEWGGVPACDACYSLHYAAGDHARAVLTAYKTATRDLREQLTSARRALALVQSSVRDAVELLGGDV